MKPVRGTYVASISRAWARHHWWACKVHDMPNADYQRGLMWFKEWRTMANELATAVSRECFSEMAALRSELKGLYNMARSRHIQRRENALMAIRKHNYTQVKFEPCSVYSQTRDWFDMREARLWLDYQAALGNNSFRYGRGGRGQPPKLPSR